MGTNSLNNRSAGQTITDTFFNDLHQAMNSDFVGRGATGVPTSGQNLGTTAIPWGTVRANSLVLNGAAVDTSQLTAPQNRVISGKKRASSNQPAYIVPAGSGASFTVDGTPTNLVVDINGASVTISTDIVKSSLTTAPASQNTALVNDTDAADQFSTKTWGEYLAEKEYITIDTVGSNITALVGKWAAFKIVGVGTEYFLAFVESATRLSKCFRGYFYDASINPMNRTGFSNNDTITLMSLAWIFVENDSTTVDVTYNNPEWNFTAPSSPVTGDYWYDLGNQVWKRYDGASFQIINRTYIGQAILDTTNCIGARAADFYANYSDENSLGLELQSTEIVRARRAKSQISVAGMKYYFGDFLPKWNITTNLAPSTDLYDSSEQNSRAYYLYLKDTGAAVISDIHPYYRGEFQGFYHPHNPWRMVGTAYNDSSGDLIVTAGEADKISASHYRIGTQSVPSATTSPIEFNTELYDNCKIYDTATFTFTIPKRCRLKFSALGTFSAFATGGRVIGITVNGVSRSANQFYNNTASYKTGMMIVRTIDLWPGYEVTVTVFQDAGGALDIQGTEEETNVSIDETTFLL
jgi:hypothetical protein